MVNATAGGGGGTVATAINLAGIVGGINTALAAAAAAGEVVLDLATMENVRTQLTKARDILVEASGDMNAIPASALGGSPVAAQLKKHSSLASDRLLETIKEMETGLANYETVMATFQKEFVATDDTATTDVKAVDTNLNAGQTCTGDGTTTTQLPQCQG